MIPVGAVDENKRTVIPRLILMLLYEPELIVGGGAAEKPEDLSNNTQVQD